MTCAYQFAKLKFDNHKELAIRQILILPNIPAIWYSKEIAAA